MIPGTLYRFPDIIGVNRIGMFWTGTNSATIIMRTIICMWNEFEIYMFCAFKLFCFSC